MTLAFDFETFSVVRLLEQILLRSHMVTCDSSKRVTFKTALIYSLWRHSGLHNFSFVKMHMFQEGLKPENLVTNDHYIAHYFADLKRFWIKGSQLHVAVLQPPNFTDPIQRYESLWFHTLECIFSRTNNRPVNHFMRRSLHMGNKFWRCQFEKLLQQTTSIGRKAHIL